MSKILWKITHGFVMQKYVESGDTRVPVGQEFTAGDDVTWEDELGNVVDTPVDHVYQPFEMVQPEPLVVGMGLGVKWEELEYDGTPVRRMSAEEMDELDEKVRRAEELEDEERWRDEKRGLYPGVDDPAN